MKTTAKNENYIFLFAFVGALLFVAAIGFVIAHFTNVTNQSFNLSGAMLNGCSSLFLLYKAVKHDKERTTRY